MAFVKYRGEIYPARLSCARFRHGEVYVTAKLDTAKFKVEKEIHFSAIISYDWSKMTKAA